MFPLKLRKRKKTLTQFTCHLMKILVHIGFPFEYGLQKTIHGPQPRFTLRPRPAAWRLDHEW